MIPLPPSQVKWTAGADDPLAVPSLAEWRAMPASNWPSSTCPPSGAKCPKPDAPNFF